MPTSFPPNSLSLRWLAELVRRHEERHPPLDEARAHAEARAVAGDLEARVLRRAARLEAASGWREAILR